MPGTVPPPPHHTGRGQVKGPLYDSRQGPGGNPPSVVVAAAAGRHGSTRSAGVNYGGGGGWSCVGWFSHGWPGPQQPPYSSLHTPAKHPQPVTLLRSFIRSQTNKEFFPVLRCHYIDIFLIYFLAGLFEEKKCFTWMKSWEILGGKSWAPAEIYVMFLTIYFLRAPRVQSQLYLQSAD